MSTFSGMTKSKRFRLTIIVLAANFAIFMYGIYKGADLSALGTGLSLLNTPLICLHLRRVLSPI